MSILVVAEHNNAALNASTYPTVTAATKLGSEVHVLVAGSGSAAVAAAASKINSVAKVLHADDAAYANGLAENLAALIVK
ncbi:MAG TPA: electron transfer flavoprotein subunit alpha/FixB family protein, partial [Patescibacteria group bacterium]|nr:electron transfer flavoprotein subunit alpha/FixB family protein [Patescibacteria group bacterium]